MAARIPPTLEQLACSPDDAAVAARHIVRVLVVVIASLAFAAAAAALQLKVRKTVVVTYTGKDDSEVQREIAHMFGPHSCKA